MQRKILKRLTILIFAASVSSGYPSIGSDLNHFFNNMGFSNNVTAPNAYQGQGAGYYSGGSLFARDSVRDVQIASIDLPSFRSGCGGIDLFTGGFSFVNSQQLVNAMQNIINNSIGYDIRQNSF